MPTQVRLPALADSVESAKFVSWLVRSGEKVVAGQPIAEVETDKATMEIEAPASGVIGTLHVSPGTDAVPIGTVLGEILADAEPHETSAAPEPTPSQVPIERSPEPTTPREAATPLAARMAEIAGLDLTGVSPSLHGRITKSDVERLLGKRRSIDLADIQTRPGAQAAPAVRERTPSADGSFTVQPLTPMRRVTAARLQEAKRTVPHFYLQADCRVDALMTLRAQLNTRVPAKLTVTDFVLFAAAQALQKVPAANSAWVDEAVRIYERVDIAVAVNTPRGLITPVVRDCGAKSLAAISQEVKQLSERARQGRLTPDEYTGGTFTVSNLGMFGVTSITPIVNPPQSCILGVGTVESRPVIAEGQIAAGFVMSCTLAADHRAVDGATGAEFLAHIRRLLENPLEMALHL